MDWKRCAAVLLVASVLQGCDKDVPQTIELTVAQQFADPGVTGLFSSLDCSGERIPSVHANARIVFATTSIRGGIGVVTQELSVCVHDEESWRAVWSSRHGGGARLIRIDCTALPEPCSEDFEY